MDFAHAVPLGQLRRDGLDRDLGLAAAAQTLDADGRGELEVLDPRRVQAHHRRLRFWRAERDYADLSGDAPWRASVASLESDADAGLPGE